MTPWFLVRATLPWVDVRFAEELGSRLREFPAAAGAAALILPGLLIAGVALLRHRRRPAPSG